MESPVSLSLQHSAWKERELVKWASAIEHMWKEKHSSRNAPGFTEPANEEYPPIEDIQLSNMP